MKQEHRFTQVNKYAVAVLCDTEQNKKEAGK
jgi:hypothetical protein